MIITAVMIMRMRAGNRKRPVTRAGDGAALALGLSLRA